MLKTEPPLVPEIVIAKPTMGAGFAVVMLNATASAPCSGWSKLSPRPAPKAVAPAVDVLVVPRMHIASDVATYGGTPFTQSLVPTASA
jgi:hypothetical protein